MRRTVALSLIVMIMAAANAFAGAEARMVGKLIDGITKKPVENGVVKLEAIEGKTVKQEIKAKADGSYAVFLLDGTIRYKFTFSAPGYMPREDTLKLKISDTTTHDVELLKAGQAPAGAVAAVVDADPTVLAYNAGVTLLNGGDPAGALVKFEEAVAAKPDLIAGWIAIAKTSYKLKDHKKAIAAALKVVDIDDSDTAMWGVLHQSYLALGDKENAVKAEKKLPANANALFNEAARLINTGKDSDAEKLLAQAIELDPAFAQAHYEIGMVFVRSGRSAEAKASLSKYLELAPDGKDAATAKEMMKYL